MRRVLKTWAADNSAPKADAGDSRGHASLRLRQASLGESQASRRPAPRERARIDLTEGAYVDCAGVILLHPFLVRFFETLGYRRRGST
jgi:hypothetical protein